MILKYCFLITFLNTLFFLNLKAQYKQQELEQSIYVYTINKKDIKTLGIDSITVYKYISDSLKKVKLLNSKIFSKKASFYFSDGKLVRDAWSYSGVDTNGINHLKGQHSEFVSLPYVYENYYNYEGDSVISIDQNTPFKKFTTDLIVIKNAKNNQILINGISIIKFRELFLKTDKDEFLIEISNSLSLYFKILD